MSRRRQKLPTFLTEAEANRLLAAARSPRDRCLFAVMLLAGLRVAEACALRVERVNLERGELLVFRGKNGKDRLLPIGARLLPILRSWIGDRTEGYLFPGRKPGRPLTTRAAYNAVCDAASRAGITRPDAQRISPHKLRHSCATNLLATGADITVVRDILGHSDVSVTSVYLHCSADRLRGAVDRL